MPGPGNRLSYRLSLVTDHAVFDAVIPPEGMDVVAIYSESDLVVPALAEIARHREGIETAALLIALRRSLRPEGDDLLPLKRRADDRFSQKVRNLKSHDTLERDGFATYDDVSGKYRITDKGLRLVEAGEGVTEFWYARGSRPVIGGSPKLGALRG